MTCAHSLGRAVVCAGSRGSARAVRGSAHATDVGHGSRRIARVGVNAMYEPPADPLMTLPTAALAAPRVEPGSADAAVMCGFAFTSMLSVVLFLAGMPLISMRS